MATTDNRLYTIDEVCDLFRCGKSTIYKLMDSGELRSVKIGALRRIPVKAADEYLARQMGEAVTVDAA
ncbi:helix-turn-helix domain-containing protein [Micromonospora inyonensis]|uniref:DNA binding domain-containing protein, excisionase family n=1 Tax=Micromonospora inyonensis TaxID=47866 RepID=A0A1C6SSR9_9ACTN|nr:helix-turn-helix domain-containing protein [Micromonospora inyonensis]SCL25427.1 DNA binding domain-containing protein, excisionase family [Micromonospora inyonensis]SCL32215.1 DNA binding domain-containing protein, excisionase family [Micromonospora inyonensis]